MGFKCSSLRELETLRRRGSKPEDPVVIADDWHGASWGRRNRYFVVDRRDVADDMTAFSGLDVWIRTGRPFAESAELAFALGQVARFVTLVDSRSLEKSSFVSSMGAVSALAAA